MDFKKGRYWTPIHDGVIEGLAESAEKSRQESIFKSERDALEAERASLRFDDGPTLSAKRNSLIKNIVDERLEHLGERDDVSKNYAALKRLARDAAILAAGADEMRRLYYKRTGRPAEQVNALESLESLEQALAVVPIRPSPGRLETLHRLRERLQTASSMVDAEIDRLTPAQELTEATDFRLSGRTFKGA